MGKVFDDETVARAFRDASEALRRGDPDTLAGRFVPPPAKAAVGAAPADVHDGFGQPRRRVRAG